ncbi:MAG: hypothetical protein IJN79_01850 [Clostridia bacterium]|nr:hypothetical protein [Clostridia bacterium]MBQ7051529.1 hypothetical protein [Clostridia bacterium]
MGFFNKIRENFARFMSGRYGTDQLNSALLWAAIIIMLVGSFSGLSLFSLLGDVVLIVVLVRMFSKDRYRRQNENQIYLQKTYKLRQGMTEWVNRMKNSKKYRYFTCPQCKKRLRVPRGVGSITITCKGCGHKFDKKA